jgi:3-hydroxyisobutyrate dehydrogenase-like beta-hydroxyacid dehydrogenase
MGTPMARNLLKGGHRLFVFDLVPQAMEALGASGATPCDSPQEIATRANVTFLMVNDGPQAEAACSGPKGFAAGAHRDTALVVTSTLGHRSLARLGELLAPTGAAIIDAPVSGGVSGAETGTLSMMVAGDASQVEVIRPILSLLATSIINIGPRPGDAQIAKIVSNLIHGVNVAALMEGLALGIRAGLDPGVLREAIRHSAGSSYAAQHWEALGSRWRHFFSVNVDPGQRPNVPKDIRLAVEMGHELQVPLLFAGLVFSLCGTGILPGNAGSRVWEPLSNTENEENR